MEYKGRKVEFGNGRMVAVSYCQESGQFGLEFGIPAAEATKEGFTDEQTLDGHRKGKIKLSDGIIRTFVTLSPVAFSALMQVGMEVAAGVEPPRETE